MKNMLAIRTIVSFTDMSFIFLGNTFSVSKKKCSGFFIHYTYIKKYGVSAQW